MDRSRAAQAAERGRGHLSWDAAQAARCPRATGTRGELEVNIEGYHGQAVTKDNWDRRVRRGAGQRLLYPTLAVGRAPTCTRPELSSTAKRSAQLT